MLPGVSATVQVFAPPGPELTAHLNHLAGFNSRPQRPTNWKVEVHASPDFLEQMLELDAGARYVGEFAFGNNPRVYRSSKNTLFDEKMGGTVHLALGNSYPETGGVNRSALHWDMVCDLRRDGEVWVDDVLFLKDGKILV